LLFYRNPIALDSSEKEKSYDFSFGFIENKGQVVDQNHQPNRQVKYLLDNQGSGIQVQLKENGFSYEVTSPPPSPPCSAIALRKGEKELQPARPSSISNQQTYRPSPC